MQIPLSEFEQVIEENILLRGLSYFEKDLVTEFINKQGKVEATVEGTIKYKAHLNIKNNIVEDYFCDCPYDLGPVCKHIAAVIFHIQNDAIDITDIKKAKPKKKAAISVNKQLKIIIEKLPEEELKTFLLEECVKDKKLKNYVLAKFGGRFSKHSKALYNKQIAAIFKTACGRQGWIGWHEVKYVANTLQPFMDNMETDLTAKNYENVFYFCSALLEEIHAALDYTDDSHGDLGYFIETSVIQMTELAQKNISVGLKNEIFEFAFNSYVDKKFDGWDWHLSMLHIASLCIVNLSYVDVILSFIEKIESGSYYKDEAQEICLTLLAKYKTENELEDYIAKNMSNYRIREYEILKSVEKKQFDKAIKLCLDGLEINKTEKPGLLTTWYNHLLKIAQAQKNELETIKYARILFIDNHSSEQNYYEILQHTVKAKDWQFFLEEIISELEKNKLNMNAIGLVRSIFIKEKYLDRLFELLKRNCSLRSIEQDESILKENYSDELILLYEKELLRYVECNVGRGFYKEACRYLRRMKKLGALEKVNELMAFFRIEYKMRSALLDELKRV